MFKNQDENNAVPLTDDFKLEDIDVHTMSKDIKELEHPTAKINMDQEMPMKSTLSQSLNEKQKSSPFLNATPAPIPEQKIPQPQVKVNTIPFPIQKNINTNNPTEKTESSSNKKIILAFVLGLLVILAVGAGAYYFMQLRQTTPDIAIVEETPPILTEDLSEDVPPANESIMDPEQTPQPIDTTEISAIMPNYLQIDPNTLNNTSLEETLNTYATDIKNAGITTPVEFVVTDQQNNPVGFANFAAMSGLKLSDAILSNLDETFSLFIFNDNLNTGIGLAISAKNKTVLQSDLLLAEKTMGTDLESIFVYPSAAANTPFEKTIYEGFDIRYQNLISPQKLSIDYVLDGKQLLIGTTQKTLEMIINKLHPELFFK
ncbi:MAG: hypothetical protein COX30_02360 [Candidatus Moranbacteria bacterium CG23_combo_of_CG06-09_8_20_14_all_39_10]|nr:MAG: hypothetical protein COX30_02360 [Candidatus Moranbacteria bacterium CG23_combo_of_CG06-09_8_20_14_all_39_10]